MPSIVRRFFVALLALALAPQLAQAQLLLCEQMDMTTATAAGPETAQGHGMHQADHSAPAAQSDASDDGGLLPACALAAACTAAPAIPIQGQAAFDVASHDSAAPLLTAPPRALPHQPDYPPPRA